jgi:hypothetical protein
MNVSSLTIVLATLGIATSASAANISIVTGTPSARAPVAANVLIGTSAPSAGAPSATTGSIGTSTAPVAGNSNWDRELEARSREIFPLASQWQQRLLWLQEQQNVKADQGKGTSYSIGIR